MNKETILLLHPLGGFWALWHVITFNWCIVFPSIKIPENILNISVCFIPGTHTSFSVPSWNDLRPNGYIMLVFLCSRQSYSVILKIARCKTISYSWVFSRYLNSMNGRFSVFSQFFHECVYQKLNTAMDSAFFKGLNFTNDQHPQNSWNLHTSKKPTLR